MLFSPFFNGHLAKILGQKIFLKKNGPGIGSGRQRKNIKYMLHKTFPEYNSFCLASKHVVVRLQKETSSLEVAEEFISVDGLKTIELIGCAGNDDDGGGNDSRNCFPSSLFDPL
jgi:hypothetical protein